MGKFFDKLKLIGKQKQDIKELEEQKKVTQLLVTFGKSPEWQELMTMFLERKESLLLMQADAIEKDKDKLAAILCGQIKELTEFLDLVKNCEGNLSMLNKELSSQIEEAKNE